MIFPARGIPPTQQQYSLIPGSPKLITDGKSKKATKGVNLSPSIFISRFVSLSVSSAPAIRLLLILRADLYPILTDNCYSQNQRYEKAYFQAIDDKRLAIMQGYQLTPDDKLRREVIQHIMCEGVVDFRTIDLGFGIEFTHYFAEELHLLKPMEEDGLVLMKDHSITLLPFGRLLLRNIAMVFDIYRPRYITDQLFSRVI